MTNPETQTTWPRLLPFYRIAAIVVGLAAALAILRFGVSTTGPLEQFYLPAAIKLALTKDLPPLPSISGKPTDGKQFYKLAFIDGELATPAAMSKDGTLSVRSVRLTPATAAAWLHDDIYHADLSQFFRMWLFAAGSVFFAVFLVGAHLDRERNNRAKSGRLIRGPRLVSRFVFNLRTRGNGLSFPLKNRRNLIEMLLGKRGRCLFLRRNREAHHIQIVGDTGSGKSTLFREIMYQVERRGDTAIIFDPDRQYIQEFYNPKRGDIVLNPKDDRCPYWYIGGEAKDEAEATALAVGLFPDEPSTQKFFLNQARAIFAFLVAKYKPTVNELAFWLAHPEEIDARVKGTEHEVTLTKNAAPQRAGILATLNEICKALRMMPGPEEGRPLFTSTEWAKRRRGWIFITSTPDTIDAVRPLQSLWLDMLILKLQGGKRPAVLNWFASAQRFCGFRPTVPVLPRVWLMIDELADLNVLPQLVRALTKQRKSGNPIVIGIQGIAQIEAAYGQKKAETIVSQAFYNFVLRTREAHASENLSNLMGKAQVERVRESKPAFWWQWRSRSFYTERVVEPVVMASQIQTEDDLHGYFVAQDNIVDIELKLRPARVVAEDLIERLIPPPESTPEPEPVAAAPAPDRTMDAGWRMFAKWCEGRMVPSLPATPDTVALFMVTMANANRSPAVINRALFQIAQKHVEAHFDNPASLGDPTVAEAWEFIKPRPANFRSESRPGSEPPPAQRADEHTEADLGLAS